MNSSADKAANLASASELVEQAARIGCALIAFPENFSWMGPESQREAAAETLQGPTLSEMAELAQRHHLMILAGSILEKGAPDNRLYNTSVLFDDQGVQRARYRKIHLFDAELPDGTSYRESSAIAPGEEVVTVTTPLGRLGLSICYDLRFPELYRQMADQQVSLILVPSAFTATTGRDHIGSFAESSGNRKPGLRFSARSSGLSWPRGQLTAPHLWSCDDDRSLGCRGGNCHRGFRGGSGTGGGTD